MHRRLGQHEPEELPTKDEPHSEGYLSINRPPDSVQILCGGELHFLEAQRGGLWTCPIASLKTAILTDRIRFALESCDQPIEWIGVRWQADFRRIRRYFGGSGATDNYRSAWLPERADRLMPNYVLGHDGKRTHGYGVAAGANVDCRWMTDRTGISLQMNFNSNGEPYILGDRGLDLCEALSREGDPDESLYAAYQAFCRQLSPHPRGPSEPVYGVRVGWDSDGIRDFAARLGEIAPNLPNRPHIVLTGLNVQDQFLSASETLRDLGLRPGVRIDPVRNWKSGTALNPTQADDAEIISRQVESVRDSGFEYIEHDLTKLPSNSQSGRTHVETLRELYDRLRYATGPLTMGGVGLDPMHAAGIFDVLCLPDELGTLDFVQASVSLGAQHGAFYHLALGPGLPGAWPHLVDFAREFGAGFLANVRLDLAEGDWSDLERAFARAAWDRPVSDPIEWIHSCHPSRWRTDMGVREFQWFGPNGPEFRS